LKKSSTLKVQSHLVLVYTTTFANQYEIEKFGFIYMKKVKCLANDNSQGS